MLLYNCFSKFFFFTLLFFLTLSMDRVQVLFMEEEPWTANLGNESNLRSKNYLEKNGALCIRPPRLPINWRSLSFHKRAKISRYFFCNGDETHHSNQVLREGCLTFRIKKRGKKSFKPRRAWSLKYLEI